MSKLGAGHSPRPHFAFREYMNKKLSIKEILKLYLDDLIHTKVRNKEDTLYIVHRDTQ